MPEFSKNNNIQEKGEIKSSKTFEFKDLAEAEEYLDWKKTAPVAIKRMVEGRIKGVEVSQNQSGLPLTDQFLDKLNDGLSQDNVDFSKIDKKVVNLISPLSRVETKGGYLDVFESLANPGVSWNLKRKIFETQIKPALDWLVEKDLEKIAEETRQVMENKDKSNEKQSSEEQKEENSLPPESEDASSSMETQSEKKEGEPNALFSVKPFYGGYFKQAAYRRLNPQTLKWEKGKDEFEESTRENISAPETKILSGKIRGNQILALPLPYDWAVDIENIETSATKDNVKILKNQNGDWHLQIIGEGVFRYQLRIAPKQSVEIGGKFSESETVGELSQELKDKIGALKKENLPKMKLARAIAKFIRSSLVYSSGSAESVAAWQYYTENPNEFFQRMWEQKKADCFAANTMAVRALAEAGLQTRFIGGYFIKEKNKDGAAVMHSGNGHGWLEVWDDLSRRAVRLDATPKGDPNVDEDQQEKDLEGETGEGDYGESEEELMPEDKLKEKIKEMKGQKENQERKKRTPADLEEARFAELAECTPEQSREFLKALDRVREIKDTRGIPISELLKLEWKKIITERKIEINDYHGPVRMDSGDSLEDPVSARIDILSKEFNPTGFEKLEKEEKIETDFGGINIYFSFDLSGSMNNPDAATGRRKADVQRDAALLFADSLMQCAYVSRQQGENSDLLPIKIMVTLASDSGDVKLNLTDKWGPKEQWAFYSALNQLASGGTPTHTTLKLIEKDFDLEIADLKKKKIAKEKLPLHYVVEISDGAPDDFAETEAMHEKLKSKGMAVRSYCIGGESASEDAAEPIASFSQLPEILSKDIIEKFKKLNPKRIK
ncbi:MAG: transglutaminase domain-containing protein [Parcubacteria group bacterium]